MRKQLFLKAEAPGMDSVMQNALPLLYHPAHLAIEGEFLEGLRKGSAAEGEVGLMLAILEDAIACFQKYLLAEDKRGETLFREAEEWILAEGGDWIFSFDNICEVLGLDPAYLRQGLMRWKERRLTTRSKAKLYHLRSGKRRPKTSNGKAPEETPDIDQHGARAQAS